MSVTTTDGRDTSTGRAGHWAVLVLAAVLIIVGALLLAGGIWLILLGGSWYYAPAGLGLVIAGALMCMDRMAGIWVYLLVYAGTLVWALWEKGLDGWAQVPRLFAPTVLLVLVLLSIPVLRRRTRRQRPGAVATALVLAFAWYGLQTQWAAPVAAQQDAPATAPLTDQEAQPEQSEADQPAGGPDRPGTEPSPDTGDAQLTDPAASEDDQPPVETLADPDLETGLRAAPGPVPVEEAGEDWPAYGGSVHARRYSPLTQITRENVADLERVWEYRTGAMPDKENADFAPETTPLKIDDDLYLCSAMNVLIAVDAATGLEEWRYDPGVSEDAIPYSASCRGVTYYQDPEAEPDALCAERIIEGTLDARLIAVDATTGQPCSEFGRNGQVYLEEGLGATVPSWVSVTSPPTIIRGVIVVGHQVLDGQAEDAPSGVVRGYDSVTGELLWAWDMGRPELNGEPPEGEVYTRGTPNMWTIASGDEELGHVYLPLGNSSVDYYGANRSDAENEYSTSLVALDVTTGEPVWHFQTVHYDVWDYDLGSQATLVDFPTGDGTVPALILSSKQGEIYVLDRRTGEPLFPVEERAVPQGGVEPENLSPTQPFSAYHSLLMPPLEEADMWGMSPLDQLWCRIQYRRAVYEGIYTPPTSDRHWIQYPGYNGGQDWGSMAVDVERGILIANYNDIPNYNRLVPREQVEEAGAKAINEGMLPNAPQDLDPQAGAPYGIDVNAGWRLFTGMPCTEPPYGGIRAIDLATGETIWDQPLGEARRNGPFGIPSMLPIRIGTPNNGGPLITAGGLVFIAAATDDLIRAIDIETGEVLWEDTLPAGGQATPITYEANGRQFIAFMAGGHHFMETPIGDYVIAWALPEAE